MSVVLPMTLAQAGTIRFGQKPTLRLGQDATPAACHLVVRCADDVAEGRFLAAEIAALLKYKHYTPADICVVARNRHYRALAVAGLKAAGIPVYSFRDPDAGEAAPDENAVRVSSLHGAKGHEFGTVFVAGAAEGVMRARRRE